MAFSDGYLRMLSIESFGQDFHQENIDLVFSGKKMIYFQGNMGIIEADPSYETIPKSKQQLHNVDVDEPEH